MTRLIASGVVAAALLGLVRVEVAALVLAGLAFVVSASAYAIATTTRRSLQDTIEQQSSSARALVSAARDVDSRLREDA